MNRNKLEKAYTEEYNKIIAKKTLLPKKYKNKIDKFLNSNEILYTPKN